MKDYERGGIIRKLHQRELELLQTKGREYTGGAEAGNELDVLHNFKDVAKQAGTTPLQAWAVYFLKHVSSIMTHIADPYREMSESIDGRIEDARTYLGLLQCLLSEEREQHAITHGDLQEFYNRGSEHSTMLCTSPPPPERLHADAALGSEPGTTAAREAAQQAWRDGQERAHMAVASDPLPDRAALVDGPPAGYPDNVQECHDDD